MKALIADDSAPIRRRLRELVSNVAGIDLVGEAGTAPEAIAAIERLQPDVAVLDLRMPGGGGLHVLRAVKAHQPAPVIIVLTAFAQPQHREACLAAGADYFFDKTHEFERVSDLLQRMMQR